MWMTEQTLMDELNIGKPRLYVLRCTDKYLKSIPTVKRNGKRVYLESEAIKWIKQRRDIVKEANLKRKQVLSQYRLTKHKQLTNINNSEGDSI